MVFADRKPEIHYAPLSLTHTNNLKRFVGCFAEDAMACNQETYSYISFRLSYDQIP